MSHSQRQKKRTAQFRKKHFEAKGRGQGEKKKDEQKQVSAAPSRPQQPQTEETERPGRGKLEVHQSQNQDERTDHSSKFSRRKVASNWERYADMDSATYSAETEEQLQMRLVQLLNLPQAPPDPWTPEEEEGEGAGEGGSYFSLNVTQLAESLRSLPTHTRLSLPLELLHRYGVSEEDLVSTASEAAVLTDNTVLLPSTGKPSSPAHNTHTVSSSGDLKSLLSKNSTAKHTFDFGAPGKIETEDLQQSHGHIMTDRDLEDLLRTSSQLPTSHKALLHTPHSTPTHGQGKVMKSVSSQQSATVVPTTEQLDSMLDDLLA